MTRKSAVSVMLEAGYLTINAAADRAGVDPSTIRRLVHDDKIESVWNGPRRYISARSLAGYYSAPPIARRIMEGVGE